MTRKGKASPCIPCQSKDPEMQMLMKIQTYSFLCGESFLVLPYAGMHAHFVRAKQKWWDQIPAFSLQFS